MHDYEKRDLVGLIGRVSDEDHMEVADALIRQATPEFRELVLSSLAAAYVATDAPAADRFAGRISGAQAQADGDGPSVLSTSPAAGAADVAVDAPVWLYFDQDLDPATVIPENFAVLFSNGTPSTLEVTAAESQAATPGWNVRLTLDGPFDAGTGYKLRATADIMNKLGVPMAGAYTSATAFTTAA